MVSRFILGNGAEVSASRESHCTAVTYQQRVRLGYGWFGLFLFNDLDSTGPFLAIFIQIDPDPDQPTHNPSRDPVSSPYIFPNRLKWWTRSVTIPKTEMFILSFMIIFNDDTSSAKGQTDVCVNENKASARRRMIQRFLYHRDNQNKEYK